MNPVVYDGSFEGLLTAIFEIYEYKIASPQIVSSNMATQSLFGKLHHVVTDKVKAGRVHKKLVQNLTQNACAQLYKTYLSELRDIENVIYRYVNYILSTMGPGENNFSHPDVLMLQQVSRKVHREKHRMEAFVRFKLTGDGLYYCLIGPDHNVLPLISAHFEKRYADQRWLIYDSIRKYGIYYDMEGVSEITLNFSGDVANENFVRTIADEKEELYQQLWCTYFANVNIPARKNMKLHIQHMPKRYWRYLTEKRKDITGGL